MKPMQLALAVACCVAVLGAGPQTKPLTRRAAPPLLDATLDTPRDYVALGRESVRGESRANASAASQGQPAGSADVQSHDLAATQPQEGAAVAGEARFGWLDVVVDAGRESLAAYQVRLEATAGDVKIVGVEGGEHAAFAEPPYYDPAAMMRDRVIIAAFDTGRDLPTGKARVARIHVMITGDQKPEYSVKVEAMASLDGKALSATVHLTEGANQ